MLARHCVCYRSWFQLLVANCSHRNCTCTAQARPTMLCICLVIIIIMFILCIDGTTVLALGLISFVTLCLLFKRPPLKHHLEYSPRKASNGELCEWHTEDLLPLPHPAFPGVTLGEDQWLFSPGLPSPTENTLKQRQLTNRAHPVGRLAGVPILDAGLSWWSCQWSKLAAASSIRAWLLI